MKEKLKEKLKEAFRRGWDASHECATDYDYEIALSSFFYDLEAEDNNEITTKTDENCNWQMTEFKTNEFGETETCIRCWRELKIFDDEYCDDCEFDLIMNGDDPGDDEDFDE